MLVVWEETHRLPPRRSFMHDILIGTAFIVMVLTPAIVAAYSGTSEANAE